MKIIQCSPDMDTDRMYCPSTDEVIFAPDYEEINDSAEAFIAYWHGEVLDQPEIKDPKLKVAWDKYFEKWDELSEEMFPFDIVEKFLRSYRNSKWKVFECTFHGMACGPVSTTVYYVVKDDTFIEEDPNYDKDAEESLKLKTVQIPDSVNRIENGAFAYDFELEHILIPSTVTSIGDKAFYLCNELKNIQIPDFVLTIGKEAFYKCDKLESFQLPNSLISIGDCAFSYCSGLKSINIPKSITDIGDNPFIGCPNLNQIQVDNDNLVVEDGFLLTKNGELLSCFNSLPIPTLPKSVKSIGNKAFHICKTLEILQLPESVTRIGKNAVSCCHNLKSVRMSHSVVSIEDEAFAYCFRLNDINIPNSITSIGNKVFFNCSDLESIEIPDSVISIGDFAFGLCGELKNIRIPNSTVNIGENPFLNCSMLKTIEVERDHPCLAFENDIYFLRLTDGREFRDKRMILS
jgi:hypothetical protein